MYGFTGEYAFVPIPPLLYLRARYYHMQLGVFISADPVEGVLDLPLSLNGYSYAHGNPVTLRPIRLLCSLTTRRQHLSIVKRPPLLYNR
jgi:RHS repeat-associated protein